MFHSNAVLRLISRGLSTRGLANSSSNGSITAPRSVAVLGAPFWNGQPKSGTELAPDALRANGLLNKLTAIQSNVIDMGNLHLGLDADNFDNLPKSWPSGNHNKNAYLIAQMVKRLSTSVASLIDKEYLPMVLGGDHSIAVGSVLGTCSAKRLQGEEISLLWIDAHADANTEDSSKSGNYHGMPVTFLLKEVLRPGSSLFADLPPARLSARNVAFIGLRDVELQELQLLQKMNLTYFSMEHVDRLGIAEVVARALDAINPSGKNPLHVSFDVDSVDDASIVSTGTPVIGGLTVREAMTIGRILDQTSQMVALDVVEFNPKLGTPAEVSRSAKYITDIVLSFFGKSRAGYFHHSKEQK
ncbi:Amino-acid acetyltransferase, mitochondrial [Tyrophagus putrescentiae]|nr:Amino-acid acetyltransferase, mitochondrial [Tyrophagus putrescentiae]